jgi:hypothetical protein
LTLSFISPLTVPRLSVFGRESLFLLEPGYVLP